MKVILIEDESGAARRLENLIREIDPDIEILANLDSVESSVEWLETHSAPDLIFQDIQLADGSSFEIFKKVDVRKPIIFTTAYDQYAIDAFRSFAIDYLLKPVKKRELQRAIEKYKDLTGGNSYNYQRLLKEIQKENYNLRFMIRIGQQIKVVEIGEVAYFYTKDKITFLITHEGKRYPIDYSLEKLEEEIDPRSFFRINRQVIIHISAIKEMIAYSKSRVKIDLKQSCDVETIVSTERSPFFKKWLVGEL